MSPREVRQLWAQALESGEYKQGDGQLTRVVDGEELDCCPGVACKLAMAHHVIKEYDGNAGDLTGYPVVREWLGLVYGNGTYVDRRLTEDNDSGVPFPEIAKTIREEPEGLVVA